ncbi:MAG: hypothetical protein E4H07_05330 [Nitrosomonadales bacterium]|nr:MAG: hypothetical protein E4H07_05330 [Nitrosomonadales bacterium]
MAKKETSAKAQRPIIEDQVEQTTNYQTPKHKEPVESKTSGPVWEIKDRVYFVKGRKQPIILSIPSKHTAAKSLLWFDPVLNYQRELRYATNQRSVFVDEQQGPVTMRHIIFRDGKLLVPAREQALQQLLSLYHPHKDKLYFEFNAEQEAVDELDSIELELEALNLATSLDIETLEAIIRVDQGSRVKNMTSKEIKRDALIYAKRNPVLFIDLAKDENVNLRNSAIKSVEQGFINISPDQRTFNWSTTGRKLMTVPFDENPYSALAMWFKTDEGIEVYQNLEKRLK